MEMIEVKPSSDIVVPAYAGGNRFVVGHPVEDSGGSKR